MAVHRRIRQTVGVKKQKPPRHKTVHPTVDRPMVLENGNESIAIGFTDKKRVQDGKVLTW